MTDNYISKPYGGWGDVVDAKEWAKLCGDGNRLLNEDREHLIEIGFLLPNGELNPNHPETSGDK